MKQKTQPEPQAVLPSPAATVLSWSTNASTGGLTRNYRLEWHKHDLGSGTKLFTEQQLRTVVAQERIAFMPTPSQDEVNALWNAVNWMEIVLRERSRIGFKDREGWLKLRSEESRLFAAKRIMRKIHKAMIQGGPTHG